METQQPIDNSFYDTYGERWYTAFDDPIALLRAENNVKIPWILDHIRELGSTGHNILDVGCGGGFLTNNFAKRGFTVTGVDLSEESLNVARSHDVTHSVNYIKANAYQLPLPDGSFDVVTNMDFLEHVDRPGDVVKECSRVLKPGGLFFFHTFNRNKLSEFVVIKLVEKFIKNTPKNMHVLDLFITPQELREFCQKVDLEVLDMTGIRPVISSVSFRTLFTGEVSPGMKFVTTRSQKISYMGVARKKKLQVRQ